MLYTWNYYKIRLNVNCNWKIKFKVRWRGRSCCALQIFPALCEALSRNINKHLVVDQLHNKRLINSKELCKLEQLKSEIKGKTNCVKGTDGRQSRGDRKSMSLQGHHLFKERCQQSRGPDLAEQTEAAQMVIFSGTQRLSARQANLRNLF